MTAFNLSLTLYIVSFFMFMGVDWEVWGGMGSIALRGTSLGHCKTNFG